MKNIIEISIRHAEKQDAMTVLGMMRVLARHEQRALPGEANCARFLEDGWGETPRFQAWLAEKEGQPIGVAITVDVYQPVLTRSTLSIQHLFVLPENQRCGVGSALLLRLAQEACTRGYDSLEWCCSYDNHPAQTISRRLGGCCVHKSCYHLTLDV